MDRLRLRLTLLGVGRVIGQDAEATANAGHVLGTVIDQQIDVPSRPGGIPSMFNTRRLFTRHLLASLGVLIWSSSARARGYGQRAAPLTTKWKRSRPWKFALGVDVRSGGVRGVRGIKTQIREVGAGVLMGLLQRLRSFHRRRILRKRSDAWTSTRSAPASHRECTT